MRISLKNTGPLRPHLFWLEVITWTMLAGIYAFAFWVQSQIYLHGDPSWGMEAALRMLHGGNYWQDFFDVDAPMTFYIYLVPAAIAASLKLSPVTVVRAYSFILAGLSWWVCRRLLKHGLDDQSKVLGAILQIAIAFIFLILPVNQFGQREQILLFLTLPYFLLVFLRASDQSVNTVYAFILGLLAGIGFAIKPFFLFSLVFVEIYLALRKKTFHVWWRPEALAIMLVMLGYLASVFLLFPEYLFRVIPLVAPIYYPSANVSFGALVINAFTLMLIIISFLQIALRSQLTYPILSQISLLATWGFWLSFITQQTLWYYHAVPYLALAFFTLVLISSDYLVGQWIIQKNAGKPQWLACCFVSLSSLLILIYFSLTIVQTIGNAREVKKNPFNARIISEAQQLTQGGSFYYFSVTSAYPLADYAQLHSASRFATLWMSSAIFGKPMIGKPIAADLTKQKIFLRNAIIEDLQRSKPKLILVSLYTPPLHQNNFILRQPDFIRLLAQDPRFEKIWRQYRYVVTIEGIEYYVLKQKGDT